MLEAARILEIVVNVITLNEFMRQAITIDHELYTLRPRVYVFSDELVCASSAIQKQQEKLDSLIQSHLGPDIAHTTESSDDPGLENVAGILDLIERTRQSCTILISWLDQAATTERVRWISIRHALRTVCSKERIVDLSSRVERIIGKARARWSAMATTCPEAYALDEALVRTREGASTSIAARLLEGLQFRDMSSRYDNIPKAHRGTLGWVYEGVVDGSFESAEPINFKKWLRSDEGTFWIFGQPGVGKSAIIKKMYNDERTLTFARDWAKRHHQIQEVRLASFWFWKAGSREQRSMQGLLRSLLHQLLHDKGHNIKLILKARSLRAELFEQVEANYTDSELHLALEAFLAQNEECLLIFLDGLDEYEGNSYELASLIQKIAAAPRVKICMASRPWPAFVEAFASGSRVYIKSETHPDIEHYVESNLGESRTYCDLEAHNSQAAEELKSTILEKCKGSFLWVHIAVHSLLEGLKDGDCIDDLRQRLTDVHPVMEAAFRQEIQKVSELLLAQSNEATRGDTRQAGRCRTPAARSRHWSHPP